MKRFAIVRVNQLVTSTRPPARAFSPALRPSSLARVPDAPAARQAPRTLRPTSGAPWAPERAQAAAAPPTPPAADGSVPPAPPPGGERHEKQPVASAAMRLQRRACQDS